MVLTWQLPIQRCAIYTRKSSDRLLDREINSLSIQREICSAYVTSQQHKGWVLVPKQYDDGAQSGLTIERPALSELMCDIEAGKVDVVVIYKIDRLTRSLVDFVRMIETFDRYGTNFVSVSQSFDTADSMGRMILNILLTFSQFERELIADRIRDNIRSRKQHGKWHGGPAPYGYKLTDNGLAVLESEAIHVRQLFERFLELGSYSALRKEVLASGLRTTVKLTSKGVERGGRSMSAGHVYAILKNPIYVGEIRGEEGNYRGEHEPIISRELWEAAQDLRALRAKSIAPAKDGAHFLPGLLWDSLGRRMILAVEWDKGRPYHYYVSSSAGWSHREGVKPFRSHADRLQALVVAALADFLSDREKLRSALGGLAVQRAELEGLVEARRHAVERLRAASGMALGRIVAALLLAIELADEHMVLTIRTLELKRFLEWRGAPEFHGRSADWTWSDARFVWNVPVRAISVDRSPVVQVNPRDAALPSHVRPDLVKLLREARKAQSLVEKWRHRSLAEHARSVGRRPLYFSRLVRLNYLAPDIVTAILDGTQPEHLTRQMLLEADLPLDWSLQRHLFGFPPLRDRHRIQPRIVPSAP